MLLKRILRTPGRSHRVEHALGSQDIDAVVRLGIRDRVRDRRERREVHDRFDAVLPQDLGQAVALGNVAHDQTARSVGDGRHVSLDKVVIGDRIVPVMQQPAEASTAHIAGASGQENLHR